MGLSVAPLRMFSPPKWDSSGWVAGLARAPLASTAQPKMLFIAIFSSENELEEGGDPGNVPQRRMWSLLLPSRPARATTDQHLASFAGRTFI
jgi:hypothetical protein